MGDADGMVMKIETNGEIDKGIRLFTTYGGANNKRFSRNGDLGVDPVDCFDLKPDYCENNHFKFSEGRFNLYYGASKEVVLAAAAGVREKDDNPKRKLRVLHGVYPSKADFKIVSPYVVTTPQDMWNSAPKENKPLLAAVMPLEGSFYISVCEAQNYPELSYDDLSKCFENAESRREKIASTIKITTPDPYLNTVGAALSVAADGIWENPAWQHGAIGWRMPLSGWRAAYVGDILGWNDRARIHFDGYAASQVTDVVPVKQHPAQDGERANARALKEWGTPMYSNGYISRNPNKNNIMHHYDMNLCYIDELLWHLNWTGDIEYAKEIWPTIERHLAWEKRNYDPDNNGLYDAYCCIWASDALYYNSGAVTHSTAYNYRANKLAADIASKIGVDPKPYEQESSLILNAINSTLWMPEYGRWAEFKDYMGKRNMHHKPALWTIYHAIDSDVQDPYQGYQAAHYVKTEIPHIPVRARGLKDDGYATVSTTNWFPYAWSINNVAHAEVAHTALSLWQAGRNEDGFMLLKSMFLDGMYLGGSPGNFGQISFYDAARGECYRDFGDPVGITSRAVVQGLFGIIPDMLNEKMTIRPGFPAKWDHASISAPYLSFDFKRSEDGMNDLYSVRLKENNGISISNEPVKTSITRNNQAYLTLSVKAQYDRISAVTVNGEPVKWELDANGIDEPVINITTRKGDSFDIEIRWSGDKLSDLIYEREVVKNNSVNITPSVKQASIVAVKDPQNLLIQRSVKSKKITAKASGKEGERVSFVKLKQGDMSWWEPVNINVMVDKQHSSSRNVLADVNDKSYFAGKRLETVEIGRYFNSSVCDIFKNKYDSPRSPFTTLQIPLQGIGEWCHPDQTAVVDDKGLIYKSENGVFTTGFGLPFRVSENNNIVYSSLWDRYPDKVSLPLSGSAQTVYLLMAGSTNHMQCHIANGVVTVNYKDGTKERLELINPTTWYPIEQDFYFDDAAFKSDYPRAYRVMLKTGEVTRTPADIYKYKSAQDREIGRGHV